jgi:hypothetical protein
VARPPALPGHEELIASVFTEGLVGGGGEVTLFATLDSLTAAELDGVVAAPAKLWRHGQSGVVVGCVSNPSSPGNDSPAPRPGAPARPRLLFGR